LNRVVSRILTEDKTLRLNKGRHAGADVCLLFWSIYNTTEKNAQTPQIRGFSAFEVSKTGSCTFHERISIRFAHFMGEYQSDLHISWANTNLICTFHGRYCLLPCTFFKQFYIYEANIKTVKSGQTATNDLGHKKPPEMAYFRGFSRVCRSRLSLRELRCSTSRFEAVLVHDWLRNPLILLGFLLFSSCVSPSVNCPWDRCFQAPMMICRVLR